MPSEEKLTGGEKELLRDSLITGEKVDSTYKSNIPVNT